MGVLLVAVPSHAQSQLSANPNPVALTGSAPNAQVTIGGSGDFTITNQVGSFFSVVPQGFTAPTGLGVQATNVGPCTTSACSGSFTLHPTQAGGGTDVVVQVTFTPGIGGGGGVGGAARVAGGVVMPMLMTA